MKLILFVTILMSSVSSIGQDFVKSKEDYTAKNGQVFKVGQTITLGTPGDFSNDFMYYTQGASFMKKAATGTVKIGNSVQNYDYRFNQRTIKQFKIYPGLGTFAVVDKVFNEMINLDRAIDMREIMTPEHVSALIHSSKLMSDSIAYLRMLSIENSVTDLQVKEFSYLFNTKKYRQIREDEFEFHKFISNEKKRLESLTKGQRFNDSLKLMVHVELGNYDFERGGFPVQWNNRTEIKILNDQWESLTPGDINKNQVELTDLIVSLNNTDDFSFLPLNEEKANLFVKHRKSNGGSVNRQVTFFIHFAIKDLRKIDREEYYTNFIKDEKVLDCDIFKICVFEDDFGYNWLNNIVK